jgi:hypothetical protein
MSGFLEDEKLRYVWNTSGFKTDRKPVVHRNITRIFKTDIYRFVGEKLAILI